MKRCPQCHRIETDDALAFCRVDGTALVTDSTPFRSEGVTAQPGSPSAASEIETSLLPHSTDGGIGRATEATSVLDAQHTSAHTHKLTGVKRRKAVALVVAGLIVTVLIVSIYFYRSRTNSSAIDSIAVLPFANTSADPNTDFLSDGITESIISSLSQLSQLKVMARSRSFNTKAKRLIRARSVMTSVSGRC